MQHNNNNDDLLKMPKTKQQKPTEEKKVTPASKHRKSKTKSSAAATPTTTPATTPIKSSSKVTKASAQHNVQKMIKRNLKNEKFIQKLDLSPCLTPPDSDPSDLGLMLLESDGESLHLSEPCLSPFEQHMKSHFSQSIHSSVSITNAEHLELGLLLESDGESLHLSEPCLSPLSHLDSLNPFGDLLHVGFNEQTALDMFLS